MTEMTDGLNNTTAYAYDNAGNLISVTDPLGKVTQYGYDIAGNKTSMTDAKTHTTGYSYSAFGMLLSITDPAGRVQAYKYNLTGQKAKMVDRIGNTTSYAYNSLGLLTNMSVVEAGESVAADSIGYDYDSIGNRTEMTDSTGVYSYTYNELLRLETVSKNACLQISYTYTAEGNIETVSCGGTTTAYAYYSNGRLHTVRNSGHGADYDYDASGNVELISYVGGAKEQFAYYKNNAAHTVTNKNSGNSAIATYTYTYDGAGRQVSKVDPYGTTTYAYDGCGRLATVAMPGKTTVYAYDDAGNRETMAETYSSPKTFNGSTNVQYVKKEAAYDYSDCNELMKITENMYNSSNQFVAGKESNYSYDPNGNQYSIVVGILTPASLYEPPSIAAGVFSDNMSDLSGLNDTSELKHKINSSAISTTTRSANKKV
jgi:YD repeat-containing protein